MPDKDPESERVSEIVSELIARVGRPGALQLLSPGKVGRPTGSGAIDDAAALRLMADLLHRGERSERKAATDSAHLTTGNSEPSIIDRLRRKFRGDRKALLQDAARRHAPPPVSRTPPRASETLPQSTRTATLEAIGRHKSELDRELERVKAYAEFLNPSPDAETLALMQGALYDQLGLSPDEAALKLIDREMRRQLGLPPED